MGQHVLYPLTETIAFTKPIFWKLTKTLRGDFCTQFYLNLWRYIENARRKFYTLEYSMTVTETIFTKLAVTLHIMWRRNGYGIKRCQLQQQRISLFNLCRCKSSAFKPLSIC